jgi:hypothetical protein
MPAEGGRAANQTGFHVAIIPPCAIDTSLLISAHNTSANHSLSQLSLLLSSSTGDIATMKECPFCRQEIQDAAIKCKHCREWLRDQSAPPADHIEPMNVEKEKHEVIIEASFIDNIISHLEFLGYKIERKEGWFRCHHERKKTFILSNHYGGILLSAWYQSNDFARNNSGDFLLYINQLNRKAIVSRVFMGDEGSLNFDAWYPDSYDKEQFGLFMDLWDYDTAELLVKLYPESTIFLL